MSRYGKWSVILRLEDIQRRVTKKRGKDDIYWERSEKLGLTTLLERKMREDFIETFKIINGISGHFFNISPLTGNYSQDKFQKLTS